MVYNTRLFRVNLIISPLLISALLFSGCATSVTLKKSDRELIRSISINKDVKIPDDMFYQGPTQTWSISMGLIGATKAAAAAMTDKDLIKEVMGNNQIDLRQIVREQFAAETIAAGVFPLIVSEGGDAEVNLEIRVWGLAQAHAFTDQLKPMLNVRGTLVQANGTILWENFDYVTAFHDQTPRHTLEEYLQNPKYIREAFTTCAKIVSEGLVNDIKK
jgi:hypothetical protein